MSSGKNANNAPSDKQSRQMAGPWQPLQPRYEQLIPKIHQANIQPWDYGPGVATGHNQIQQDAINRGAWTGLQERPELRGATNYAAHIGGGGAVGGAGGADFLNHIMTYGGGATPGTDYLNNFAQNGGATAAGTGFVNKLANKGVGNIAGTKFMSNLANKGMDPAAGTNYLNKLANKGQGPIAGQGFLDQVSSEGIDSPAYAQLQQALQMASGGSGGLEYAQGVAGGKYLDNNPYIDKVIEANAANANRQLLPALEGRMASAGRLGSGIEGVGQGEIARNLAEQANEVRFANYNQERDRQQQAGLSLPGMLGTEVGTLTGAAQATNQDYYSRIQQQLGAIGQAHGQRATDTQQRMQAQGQGYEQRYNDVNQRMAASGQLHDQRNADLNLQLGAAGQAFNQNYMAQGQRLDAAGQAFNQNYQNLNQRMAAQGQMYDQRYNDINQALQAGGQAGQNYQNEFIGYDKAFGYGTAAQSNDERIRQEQQDRFQYNQAQPYEAIQRQLGQYGQIAGVTNPAQANAMYAQSLNRPSTFQQAWGTGLQMAGAVAQGFAGNYPGAVAQATGALSGMNTGQPYGQPQYGGPR